MGYNYEGFEYITTKPRCIVDNCYLKPEHQRRTIKFQSYIAYYDRFDVHTCTINPGRVLALAYIWFGNQSSIMMLGFDIEAIFLMGTKIENFWCNRILVNEMNICMEYIISNTLQEMAVQAPCPIFWQYIIIFPIHLFGLNIFTWTNIEHTIFNISCSVPTTLSCNVQYLV